MQGGLERRREAVVSGAVHAGGGSLRVDRVSRVDRDGAPGHARLRAPRVDFHEIGGQGVVLLVEPEALGHALGQRAAPLALVGRHVQNPPVLVADEQLAAERVLVLPQEPGQLIDEDLVERAHLARIHHPPRTAGHGQDVLLE